MDQTDNLSRPKLMQPLPSSTFLEQNVFAAEPG